MYIFAILGCELFAIYLLYIFILINSPIKKILYNLFFIDTIFLFCMLIYNEYFNYNLNINYKKYINRKVIYRIFSYKKFYGKLISYQFTYILGFKYSLIFNIQRNNGIISDIEIFDFNNVKFNQKYYYSYLIYLLNKHKTNFNKLDKYIINHIKGFLY